MKSSNMCCVIIFLMSLFVSQVTFSNSTSSTITQLGDQHNWKFEITPYIWAINMNGTVHVGPVRAHVDQSFGDILSQLNWAAMLWLDAKKDKFGIFGNIIYSSLSNKVTDLSAKIKTNNNFGIYSAGLSYEVYQSGIVAIEPYAGFRYTTNQATSTLTSPFINLRGSISQGWVDPIIGTRLLFDFTKAWHLTLAGDIGGVNTNNHYSYNLFGVVGYKPQTMWKNTTWYLGYRLLDQHYITGSGLNYFNWNMKLFGPLVGVSFAL